MDRQYYKNINRSGAISWKFTSIMLICSFSVARYKNNKLVTSSVSSGWHCIYGSDYRAESIPKPTKKTMENRQRRRVARPTPVRASSGIQR